jgi:hypothetical protein
MKVSISKGIDQGQTIPFVLHENRWFIRTKKIPREAIVRLIMINCSYLAIIKITKQYISSFIITQNKKKIAVCCFNRVTLPSPSSFLPSLSSSFCICWCWYVLLKNRYSGTKHVITNSKRRWSDNERVHVYIIFAQMERHRSLQESQIGSKLTGFTVRSHSI